MKRNTPNLRQGAHPAPAPAYTTLPKLQVNPLPHAVGLPSRINGAPTCTVPAIGSAGAPSNVGPGSIGPGFRG